jgi:biopolymer transport protein ExbB/TolQ
MIGEILANMASWITSLTVIGGALVWIVNVVIVKPAEKRINKFEQNLLKKQELNQKPLTEAIDKLNELLDESQRDRKLLHEIADENVKAIDIHEEQFEDHEIRITVLEDRGGKRK